MEDEEHRTSQSYWMFEYVCEHDRMGGRWVSTVLYVPSCSVLAQVFSTATGLTLRGIGRVAFEAATVTYSPEHHSYFFVAYL